MISEQHKPLSAQDRIARGRERRDFLSRGAQANLEPRPKDFDPIEVLLASEHGRVPELMPLKYARMNINAFAFFRGAVGIMAADFGRMTHSGLPVQLCGDAHVQNLGSFATPDGKLVFDLNDFDESIRGPWEWDVKRMAASIVLAGRMLKGTRAACRNAAETFTASYCRSIAIFANQPILGVARFQIHRQKRVQPVHAALRESERARPLDTLAKLTEPTTRGPRFKNMRPTSWRVTGAKAQAVLESLRVYRENLAPERRHLFDLFRPIDVGFKVVGTGSVGLRDYVVLFEGNGMADPMFLQIKQEVASAYQSLLPSEVHLHQGQRAAEGQRAIQPISDLLLGWTTIGDHQYLVRQLNDHKGGVDLQNLRGQGLDSLSVVAGELLARGHARSGDVCEIHGYCGEGSKLARAIARFACEYADLAEADFALFKAAIRKNRIAITANTV